jgi:opacity protein-like surface antigen
MINKKTNLKLLVATLAATFALAASAGAQSANVAVPVPTATPAGGQGLLGSGYSGLAGDYFKLRSGPASAARGFTLYYNQPLADGIDLTLDYDWARARASGFKTTEQKIDAIFTSFLKESWGKPYFSAGVDWDHRRGNFAITGNSIGLLAGTGVEFQVAPAFVLTPFVNFVRETHFNQNELDYGVKATYRLEQNWSVTAKAQYDDIRRSADRMEYSVGLNYHF